MRIDLGRIFIVALLGSLLALGGCEGDDGKDGTAGPAGAAGAAGPAGGTGADGISIGTITGTVTDAMGAALQNVSIVTEPVTVTATSGTGGEYTLADVPIGVYTVIATLSGYTADEMSNVSVAAGLTATADLQLSESMGALTSLSGRIMNTAGIPLAGATASLEGTALSATTDMNGNYTITDVPAPGPYFVDIAAPAGSTYLDGGARDSVWMSANSVTVDDIMLSSQPPATATYIGRNLCAICHADQGDEHEGSAHWRSLTQDTSRMIELATHWPAVGGTIDPGVTGLDPVAPTTMVSIYWCQNTAGAYAMKFGGTADCTVADGTMVPVSGTYGGEGNHGIDDEINVGVYKQRFFAKLADVPATAGWVYTTGKDKDLLILPVQITQSGDDAPKYGGYHGKDWLKQSRTFSRKCAGCHNTGMEIEWNNDTDGYITSYDYIDFNVSCERCHGPGSAHASGGGGLANKIISPEYLSAAAERQVCGQCHAADAGHSAQPSTFGYGYNADHAGDVGGGTYVPGVYDIGDFIGNLETGGFDAWPDGEHGKAHRQQYSELIKSKHVLNPYERVTCATCHAVHTLQQGPDKLEKYSGGSMYVFDGTMQLRNNEVCLSCHATHGPFAGITLDDIAALHIDGGGTAMKDGNDLSLTVDFNVSIETIGNAVVAHMNDEANMGKFVVYDPETEPGVGRCATCHMPQTGKSGGYTTGLDEFGNTAMLEGDQSSHRFDIIAPQLSKAMVSSAGGSDTKVMPNSCGKCHSRYRYSAD